MINRTRQKNKRGDSKVESNDSLEIPDRWETSDIPGLSSGAISTAEIKYCRKGQNDSVFIFLEQDCNNIVGLMLP